MDKLKYFLFGEPFRTSQEHHERLDKVRGLAIFASDPISSNAYATEAIMSVLIVLGTQALGLTWTIAIGIAVLVLIVVFSYIQTILHYPDGGGAYTVAKDNLGVTPSLLAAAALLTDYILTVSVSVSAGIRALTSAFPEFHDYRVVLALLAVIFLTWMNLRGVRESGTVFAIPTYAFVGGVLVVILIGLTRYYGLFGLPELTPEVHPIPPDHVVTSVAYVWLILRAFAAGCTALTGIEAISNGVGAFKRPESRNAAETMVVMGVIAMALFLGISFLATHLGLIPSHSDSILSQLARTITGTGFMYYWVQFFTMLILILAANTGFQDFPRLASFLAKDGFMPRWMTNRGDRLVFNGGIIVLAVIASLLIVVFRADEIAMLPLYALGVMLSFTLSQAGMVRLMGKIGKLKPGEPLKTLATTVHHESGWLWKRLVNILGSFVTGIVFIVLVATKFLEGAWVIALAIPLFVWLFRSIRRHYDHVAEALRTRYLDESSLLQLSDVVILPMGDVHRGTLRALQYAKRIATNVRAVCVITSEEQKERLLRRWKRFPKTTEGVELILLKYDYRDVLEPLIDYIETVNNEEFPHQLTSVVIPEFVTESYFTQILHNQTANLLRTRLRHYKDIVMIDIPIHISAYEIRESDLDDIGGQYTTEIVTDK
ncbi:MAG: APC family permease [Anaerolineae bacterium]|nr:MAG: APC family permease [Anaerolineae bacterium]